MPFLLGKFENFPTKLEQKIKNENLLINFFIELKVKKNWIIY